MRNLKEKELSIIIMLVMSYINIYQTNEDEKVNKPVQFQKYKISALFFILFLIVCKLNYF